MNATTTSQRVGCYKCGAIDHVATNRNCPRPRKAATVATVAAAASRAMPPPPPPPPDREKERLKEARVGEDTCFWCYTDDGGGGGGASPGGDKDKDSRARRGCGFKWPGSGGKLELKMEAAAPGESGEVDWRGVMAFAAFSSDTPDCHSHHNHNRQNHYDHQDHDYQNHRDRDHNSREAVGTTVSTTTLSATGEVMPPPTPPPPKKVQRKKTGMAKVRADRGHSGGGAAAAVQSPGSVGTGARTAAPVPRKKVTPAKQRPLLSPPKTASPPTAHKMPCSSVGIGTAPAPNALLVPDPEDAHCLSDSTISPPPLSRRGSASTNASPGADGVRLSQEYLDWCDLPQNDPFAQQNWAHLNFNYTGDRNPDLGAGRVRYGRRLQGWRECRSLGRGLGHPFP